MGSYYLHNQWYVAAHGFELADGKPIARTICDQTRSIFMGGSPPRLLAKLVDKQSQRLRIATPYQTMSTDSLLILLRFPFCYHHITPPHLASIPPISETILRLCPRFF